MQNFPDIITETIKISPTENQISMFNKYLEILLEWNQKINLTSIDQANEVYIKHFLDSLTCFKVLPVEKEYSLIDVGTGAGFPGIPLKIMNEEIDLTLVESSRKKADFCERIITALGFKKSHVVHGRAEEIGQNARFREQFDWATARAVASAPVLIEYLMPLVKVGGGALLMKSSEVETEMSEAEYPLSLLGGKLQNTIFFDLPEGSGRRSLIEIRKVQKTPEKYPRRPGKPSKHPLGRPKD